MTSTYNFSGKLALVTGGGSGMGRAVAVALAETGASVTVADVNQTGAEETINLLKGTDHFFYKADVRSEASVKELADAIKSKYHRCPSLVVHAAGIVATDKCQSVFDITADEYSLVMDVNAKGTFLIDKQFGGWMRDDRVLGGVIVNVSSVAGKTPIPFIADYCASKSAVDMLTACFGKELAPFGIRVNAVGPFFVDTPLLAHFKQDVLDSFVAASPAKRMGKPEEVADLCLFLASNRSSYINGQVVYITGAF